MSTPSDLVGPCDDPRGAIPTPSAQELGVYPVVSITKSSPRAGLNAWLVPYNTERPHLGYRNIGRRPLETLVSFVSQEG